MQEHRYVTAIDRSGRYFTDQHGAPLLVFGDSPWAGLVRWSPQQAERYFADREARGFNASIISLIGASANGGPDDDGRAFDGLLPFDGGDVTRWNEAYWRRVDEYVRAACAHGNTLFLYPIDGWTAGNAFRDATREDAYRYGAMVAARYVGFPNIVWMMGGDHFPSDLPGRQDSPRCTTSCSRRCSRASDRRVTPGRSRSSSGTRRRFRRTTRSGRRASTSTSSTPTCRRTGRCWRRTGVIGCRR
jgi:hypothetical protein